MGKKRAYKSRKPGGGRKKLKPEYDAGKNLKEQMESAVALYDSEMSLQAIADALSLNPIKVRKLLITADVYESEVADVFCKTFLHKIAKTFCRSLQLHFVGNCKPGWQSWYLPAI